MKIFGRDISFKKKKKPNASPQILGLADQIPNLKEGNLGPSLIKIQPVKNPTMHFFAKSWAGAAGRRTFQPPEYDFVEIGKIEDVEGYVRQSFIKKTGLMFKEGFVYKGANPKYVKYINRRFSQIAKASRIPHQELVRRIGHYLVKLNNAFLIKVRDEKASGGKVRTDAKGRTIKPIAGYFPAAPETMEMLPNDAGEPVRWRQVLPDGTVNGPWPAEDVIHFYWDRKEGFLFATPSIIPAIDDIRALRRLEQEIELLVHHHLFPLFQLIVGTENAPAGIGTDGIREIDAAQEMINEMPSEGIVVTSERIKIDAVGAEAKALRAEGYLEYFQKRVWASLGMSSVDFGNADTSNRSTSDTLSLALMDGVKYIQDVLEVQWNEWVISELLLESTFDPDEVLNEDNMVKLEFREIDLDKQVKMETHAMDLFTKQGLDHDELREALGRKPWVFPEPGESVDPNTHEKFLRSFFKLFEEPLALIKAGNEPFVNTQAQAQHPSIGLDEPLVTKGRSAEEKRLQLEAKAKAAAKPKPAVSAKKKDYILIDSLLSEPYLALEDELIQEFRTGRKMDNVWVKSKLMLTQSILAQKIAAGVFPSFSQNFNRTDQEDFGLKLIQDTREIINFRANFQAKRLLDDLRSQIGRKGSEEQNVRAVFNALKYRLDFISDVETRKAANWAQMLNLYTNGYQQGKTVPIGPMACNVCLQRSESIIELSKMSYDAVLPHHSGCRCVFRGIK